MFDKSKELNKIVPFKNTDYIFFSFAVVACNFLFVFSLYCMSNYIILRVYIIHYKQISTY